MKTENAKELQLQELEDLGTSVEYQIPEEMTDFGDQMSYLWNLAVSED